MTVFKRFITYIKPFKLQLIASCIAGLIGGSTTVYLTYLTGKAIDQMIGIHQVNFKALTMILIFFFILIIITTLTQFIVQRLSYHLAYESVAKLREEASLHLGTLSMKDFDSFNQGDIISRFTNDLDNVSLALQQLLTTLFTGLTTVLVALIFMLYLSPVLTLVILLTTPLVFYFTYLVAKHSQNYFTQQQELVGQMSDLADEYIQEQEIVQLFNQEEMIENRFNKLNQKLYQVGQKAQFISSLTNPLSRFVDHLSYAGVGLVGGLILYKASGNIAVGLISSFTLYSSQFSKPFIELSGITNQLQTAFVGLNRMFELLDLPSSQTDTGTIDLHHPQGEITFDHVSFGYVTHQEIIHDFNLEVHPGQKIAIIGKTGAGKSTLINLLLRFYDVQKGEIRIDQTPIQELTLKSLRQSFGMVLQDTWFFNGTIRDNLRFGNPNASEDEIIEAAKKANAHAFIKRLPQGYDTVINQKTALSEGEKQLLSITRTFLSNPKMLILDEATSSLDTLTEQHVQEAFERLMKHRTSFIIAHRLSTIQNSDQILVIEQGRIIEHGTHDELIQNENGHYYQLYQEQFS